jgi:hypothetical protein
LGTCERCERVTDEKFDTDTVDDVLQSEDEYPSNDRPIPVCVKERVRVEELPTILGPCKNFRLAPGVPQRILDRNERRKCATFEIQNGDVCVGGTIGEARDFVGAIKSGGLGVPTHHGFSSELWAVGVNVDVTGDEIVFGPATDEVLVSVIEEFWTR